MTVELNPMKPITLEDADGNRWVLNPQSDMTPIEALQITQILIRKILEQWQMPVDWVTWIEDNRLERHFVFVKAGSKPEAFMDGQFRLLAEPVAPERISIMATRDLPGGAREGDVVTILAGMTIPDGWMKVPTDDDLEPEAGAGGVR